MARQAAKITEVTIVTTKVIKMDATLAFGEVRSHKDFARENKTHMHTDYFVVDKLNRKIIAGVATYNHPKWATTLCDQDKQFSIYHWMVLLSPKPYLDFTEKLDFKDANNWINQ